MRERERERERRTGKPGDERTARRVHDGMRDYWRNTALSLDAIRVPVRVYLRVDWRQCLAKEKEVKVLSLSSMFHVVVGALVWRLLCAEHPMGARGQTHSLRPDSTGKAQACRERLGELAKGAANIIEGPLLMCAYNKMHRLCRSSIRGGEP